MLSRAEAKKLGRKYYHTGKPCPYGHVCDRLVSTCACRDCDKEYKRLNRTKLKLNEAKYRGDRPEISMLSQARLRAKRKSVPFDITVRDIVIPTHCPILNIELRRNVGGKNAGPASPSLDRIIPELGYVRGNVRVISSRANTIKNDATVIELQLILADLLSYHN